MTLIREPESIGEISEDWWTGIFDGRLWQVDSRLIPTTPKRRQEEDAGMLGAELCYKLKEAAVYRARKKSLRLSAMVRSGRVEEPAKYERTTQLVWFLYVQTFALDMSIRENRWNREAALVAPPFPPATGLRRLPAPQATNGHADQTEVIERLLAAWEGWAVTPKQLHGHPELGWYLKQCTCDTSNFRTHETKCPVYPLLGMMERVINRQTMKPESWANLYG